MLVVIVITSWPPHQVRAQAPASASMTNADVIALGDRW